MSLPILVKPGDGIKATWANDVVHSLRHLGGRRKRNRTIYLGNGSGTGLCPFGEIISVPHGEEPSTKAIRGGMIYCGDKNWNVPDYDLDLETDRTVLLYFVIDCEVNRDDDNEILLSAIKTSSVSMPDWSDTTEETYPDNTNPDVSDGIGTIIIPIGKLVIEEGAAKFTPVACGNVTIDHCAGTLSHTRA